ncbi:hypothetical protein Goklo_020350 [Gossypium klotzschianum]|uniref:Uncharacterized protein n=1 Tax=Gossypium klotzschianum TaxID=34286 RepID=A0A7J8URJ4_9ROSI|nr:hypothetical protein [Gossypium klotzschianum]
MAWLGAQELYAAKTVRVFSNKMGGRVDKLSFGMDFISFEKVADTESSHKEIELVMDKFRRRGCAKLETVVSKFVAGCNGTGHVGLISEGLCSIPDNCCWRSLHNFSSNLKGGI